MFKIIWDDDDVFTLKNKNKKRLNTCKKKKVNSENNIREIIECVEKGHQCLPHRIYLPPLFIYINPPGSLPIRVVLVWENGGDVVHIDVYDVP